MIGITSIHASFPSSIQHASLYPGKLTNTKSKFFCLCKSKNSNSEASPPEGDADKQELLARIAMLEVQKVFVTDYLDERSAYLTQFAEEASKEFDKIGEDALKGLDEASDRIMDNIESRMQTLRESAELDRQEIKKNENKLAAFEVQIEKDRNEGLFFKSLSQRPPVDKAEAEEAAKGIKQVTKVYAGSKSRRNFYLALIGLLTIAIVNSLISSTPNWREVAILVAILAPLLTQYAYEQMMSNKKKKEESQ